MNKSDMLASLEQIRSYLHQSADADQYLSPNQELRLQSKLEEIIAELTVARIVWS